MMIKRFLKGLCVVLALCVLALPAAGLAQAADAVATEATEVENAPAMEEEKETEVYSGGGIRRPQ